MELSIQKWGNSAAVRLPAALLEQLKVALGARLSIAVCPDGVMLKPARHEYSLDQLLAQCDSRASMPADLGDRAGHKLTPLKVST